MERLSAHFTLSELTATSHGPNYPGRTEIEALRALAVNVLEPIRAGVALAVHVNSGYRSPAVNAAVGGAAGSQHLRGEAADIWVSGLTPAELATRIVALGVPFDQLIVEPSWVHVSYREGHNRGQMLRKVGNVYSSWVPNASP